MKLSFWPGKTGLKAPLVFFKTNKFLEICYFLAENDKRNEIFKNPGKYQIPDNIDYVTQKYGLGWFQG